MDSDLNFIHNILTDQMVSSGFPLVYKGKLSHQIMRLFTSMAENKISEKCKDVAVQKRVFHVIVELAQNITKHSDDFDKDGIGNGVFVVGEKQDFYYVITGNIIKSERVNTLQEHIDRLNTMTKEELDNLHRTQMKEGELSAKGGAGLGLIDLVRKTGEKLVYNFEELENKKRFFIVKVSISKEQVS
ncbi:MAG: hypothetical protein GVY19_03290 [Bacteroidetes bacterium]|jgi:hypothetical protein|nr:hypothetical protein [Bacteroidota bacterium]